ncbi:MAG: hypothetical protein IJW24_01905, partial [Clostridia bacterium]|nr:hypothetical protein [Clostridia bacterium]
FCLSDKFLIAGNVKSEILERLIKTHNKFENQGVCCQIVCKMMRETRLSFFEAIRRPFFEIFNEAKYCETLSIFVPNSDWRSFECFGEAYALGQLFDNHGGLFAFGVAHCSNEASKRPEEFEIEFFDCISGEKLKSVGIIGHL